MSHQHQWSEWSYGYECVCHRICIDGGCSVGQYRNGRVYTRSAYITAKSTTAQADVKSSSLDHKEEQNERD